MEKDVLSEGLEECYHENGRKCFVVNINKKGQRHGDFELYNSEGNLTESGVYKNGKEYGSWNFYNSDGTPNTKKAVKNDKKKKKWLFF